MYELIQVSENCCYIQSPAKIGLVRTGPDTVCLIDSGNDKDAGKKVMKILAANGWTLEAVYNTHSHADHIGGNHLLQDRTGCRIYAAGIDRDFTEHPLLEPSYLYGGDPPGDLKHKFLMAQPSQVLPLTADCLPEGWELLPLGGHSWDMVGFKTPDRIAYLADCVSSEETIEKYGINFLVDVQAYLDTLERIQTIEADLFVPAHTEPIEDIAPLAKANIAKVHEIADRILRICAEPASFESILRQLFEQYGLVMDFEQHVLVGSTVRSYLAWLKGQGQMDISFEGNTLQWRATVV